MASRLLLTSIHDVGPMFEREVDLLFDRLSKRLSSQRIAMLVVPNHWNQAPISASPSFQMRLREWAGLGVEMFVHGWFHKDNTRHQGLAEFKARHMTAREAEFLGLDMATAAQRIQAGRDLIENITGVPVAGFIAPAWLYGAGAKTALTQCAMPLAEDHFKVWSPASGRVLARGPVVTWATRSRARLASSLAFAKLARHALQPLPVARVAVHPGDARVPEALASIEATLAALAHGRVAARYADLLAIGDARLPPSSRPSPKVVQD